MTDLSRIVAYIKPALKKKLEDLRRKRTPIPSESEVVKEAVEEYVKRRAR